MNKKIIIFVLMILFFTQNFSHAGGNPFTKYYMTNGYSNGRYLIDFTNTSADTADVCGTIHYTRGIIDTFFRYNPEIYNKHYKNMSSNEISIMVQRFYKNNPDKRYLPIVDVVFDGCK